MTRPEPAPQPSHQSGLDAPRRQTADPAHEEPSSRAQLVAELAYLQGRLAELNKLDPHDFTGLARIYQDHLARAHRALAAAGD